MKKINIDIEEDLKKTLTSGVRVRQKAKTTYTTFKLTQQAHDAIRLLSDNYGKNAVVFESLIEVMKKVMSENKLLQALPKLQEGLLIRKTYVVQQKTLTELKKMAKSSGYSRDTIIEMASTLLAIIHKEKSAQQPKLYDAVNRERLPLIIDMLEKIEAEVAVQLGKDDPLYQALSMLSDFTSRLSLAIEDFIDTGEPLDPVDFIY